MKKTEQFAQGEARGIFENLAKVSKVVLSREMSLEERQEKEGEDQLQRLARRQKIRREGRAIEARRAESARAMRQFHASKAF